jgi:hypothetical protein
MIDDLYYIIEEIKYLESQSINNIENKLLPEISKSELKKLINSNEETYFIKKLEYTFLNSRFKLKEEYESLNEITKYFIEQYNFFFN